MHPLKGSAVALPSPTAAIYCLDGTNGRPAIVDIRVAFGLTIPMYVWPDQVRLGVARPSGVAGAKRVAAETLGQQWLADSSVTYY